MARRRDQTSIQRNLPLVLKCLGYARRHSDKAGPLVREFHLFGKTLHSVIDHCLDTISMIRIKSYQRSLSELVCHPSRWAGLMGDWVDLGLKHLTLLRVLVSGTDLCAGELMSSPGELPALRSLSVSCVGGDRPNRFVPHAATAPLVLGELRVRQHGDNRVSRRPTTYCYHRNSGWDVKDDLSISSSN